MQPEKARDTVKGMVQGYSAKAHIDNLYKDIEGRGQKWTYWDETIGKTVPLALNLVYTSMKPQKRKITIDPPTQQQIKRQKTRAVEWGEWKRSPRWDDGLDEELAEYGMEL